jgi:hypothetical protein
MDLLPFSSLAGTDNLRKFAVMLGLALMVVSSFVLLNKYLELSEKRIELEEKQTLDSLGCDDLQREVGYLNYLKDSVVKQLNKFNATRDSLLKCNPSENTGATLTFVRNQIESIKAFYNECSRKAEDKVSLQTKSIVTTGSSRALIKNLEKYISWYLTVGIIAILLGLGLFIVGFVKWNRSQAENDNLRKVEIEIKNVEKSIKEEELKKLRIDNAALTTPPPPPPVP